MSLLPCAAIVLSAVAATLLAAERAPMQVVHSQPCFVLANDEVELALTESGAHMAPVTFYRRSKEPIRPYYVSPWQDEAAGPMPVPVLVPLRGDFFCMPFGGNSEEVAGEKHPPHGEVAGSRWTHVGTKEANGVKTIAIRLDTEVRKGRVTRQVSVVDGQNAIYSHTVIEGLSGRMPLGHHATLAMPEKEGSVQIATSPFQFGMTCPSLFSDPRQREYQALLPGVTWKDLTKVPVAWKNLPDADLTRMPGRYGHADLVQLVNAPGSPAWVTATFADAHFVWFALKDPSVLRSTVFWMENHGRHGFPWNGRNNCLGLEDVTAFFAEGLAASLRENVLTKEGIETAVELRAYKPTVVNYIQGVAKVPEAFDGVRTLEFSPGNLTLVSKNGTRVMIPVRHEFLKAGTL